ncbi:MAG TPA: DUF2807 domain-containing protein [Agriterribacter sp.]|nr:DUF2807 domain-containing protein [Agriterribacter sp.]
MKKLATAMLGTALIMASVSCKKDEIGKGIIATEKRVVADFSGIDLNMNGNVYYSYAESPAVEITAKEGTISELETTIVADKLVIRFKNGDPYGSNENIRVDVYGPQLNSLSLSSSGSIFCLSNVQSDNLVLRTTASGNIQLKDVTANSIDAACTASGSITATGGMAAHEQLKTTASGKIDFAAVASNTSVVDALASGDVKVKVSDSLTVKIDGSGSVYFSGYPLISTQISGSGRLVRL